MSIRVVVLDIGSVLETIDDDAFPGPWEERLELGAGGFTAAAPDAGLGGDPEIGEVDEAQVRAYWQRCLGLDDATADDLMRDFWSWYVGELDQEMFDWFAGLRPRLRTALLSNSGPGAREHEVPRWGLDAVADDIVYSHEIGLAKPDPAVYELTTARLSVRPHEIVFLDDLEVNVQAARAAGWHAVVHRETRRSISEVEAIIASQQSP